MKNKTVPKESFVVQIIDNQNGTWQGTVNWVEGKKTQNFRSMLELIKLIDGAVSGSLSENEDKD